MRRRVWGVVAAAALLAGCQGLTAGLRRSVPAGYGELLVYVEALPQEAGRLRFSLSGAWAEREDGTTVPLTLSLKDLDGSEPRRQRLLLAEAVPAGRYRRVLLRAARASLRGEEGYSALLVSEVPAPVDGSFSTNPDQPAALFWEFRSTESLQGGITFSPAFRPLPSQQPPRALLGYVAAPQWRHLTVFDKKSGRVVGAIGTSGGPGAVALDVVGQRAYVALPETDAVDVVDLAASAVVERIRLNMGDRPADVHLLQDRRTLLLVNGGSDTVSFVDVATSAEVARLDVGHDPSSAVVDRTGRRAYVFNTLSNTISVLDLPNRALGATFTAESEPVVGDLNRRGDRLYVGHTGSPYLIVLDPVTGTVLKRVLLGARVSELKVDAATDLLYVGRVGDRQVSMYDPFSLLPSDYLTLWENPVDLVFDGDERQLYAVQPEVGRVSATSLVTRRVTFEIDVPGEPRWLAVAGER